MSEPLDDLERLLADGWAPIAPPRGYGSGFGGQQDIRAVQIRLALNHEPPIPNLEALKNLLWEEWDPLGVNESLAAQSEYDGYAFRIWVALERGATADQVEAYLDRVVTSDMRVEIEPGLNENIAERAEEIAGL